MSKLILNGLLLLYSYHKIDKTTTCSSLPDTTAINSISLNNYNQIFELVNDKTIPLPKDTQAKLKSSFDIIRSLFLQQKMAQNNVDNFKLFMEQLPTDATSKQSDVVFSFVYLYSNFIFVLNFYEFNPIPETRKVETIKCRIF